MEETGLPITEIEGEQEAMHSAVSENAIVSFEPYFATQNLSGIYSIISHIVLCKATGELLERTNEAVDIH